ncbi:putative amino-acid-binding protein YxeM precursor [Sporomusa ovata DSM 2662]|uniref:Amino acid ABC transporter, periplasmic amino acid-binding portion n=1 Tax=Sporomusa ovata TaxID=2378 RepID=A0A0U1L263_9FIRM|nr:transporter substrate-binding domain-containing protein [Sporomusa ovata]EQB25206.1 amino acid ABC transporter substrate-binding protein, PAAT family [Sporomusa ovata DSM 2662]CQR73767.1 Amino acid ABC transporter, periplasmic amino acid-binding portion [Sporomusa ovata]
MFGRRSIVILFTALIAMVFFAAGCGSQSTGTETKQQAAKVIRVGTSGEYYPWCFKKDDKLQGFEIDVWNEIGKRAGYSVEFKVSKFSGLFGMLDAGQIDTIAHQISTTEERRKKYDFSETYAYSAYQFVVKKDSSLNNLEDFKGKKVGVVLGGNGEKTLRDLDKNKEITITTYDGTPMEKDVEMGRLDAAWLGAIKAQTTIEQGNLNLKLASAKTGVFEINQYPFTKEEKNKQLILDVNKAIKSMQEDGTLSQISMKWFKTDTTKKQ